MTEEVPGKLVARCRGGDVSAFEKLFCLLKDDVYNLAFRVLGNDEDAEDITQEAFIKIWLNLKNFRMKSSIRTWVYRITANLCYDILEKRGRIAITEKPLKASEESLSKEDSLVLLIGKELREKLEEAFSMLKPHSRLILTLRDAEGLPYCEITSILGCSVDVAKARVHRARLEFRKAISKYLRDGKYEL